MNECVPRVVLLLASLFRSFHSDSVTGIQFLIFELSFERDNFKRENVEKLKILGVLEVFFLKKF